MDARTCPGCGGEMHKRDDGLPALQCDSCRGVFLDPAARGKLVEAENDWHAQSSTDTARLPRITPDMHAPPPRRARSFLDSLFG